MWRPRKNHIIKKLEREDGKSGTGFFIMGQQKTEYTIGVSNTPCPELQTSFYSYACQLDVSFIVGGDA
jgi:hypothetical protein